MLGAADAKSVRLVRRYAAARAQESANLVFRYALHSRIRGGNQGNLIILRIMLFVRPEGNKYFHIAGLVQRAFLFIEHANHGVKVPIHQQLLAFGSFIGKRLFSAS